jgi:hypothetical protein
MKRICAGVFLEPAYQRNNRCSLDWSVKVDKIKRKRTGIAILSAKTSRICCLFLLLLTCVFLLPSTALTYTTGIAYQREISATLPAVDPGYVYNQLFYLGTHFLRREAGYDNNLPPDVNGHDEFAAYWTQEIISKKPALAASTLQI